jgi:hypothetical protein
MRNSCSTRSKGRRYAHSGHGFVLVDSDGLRVLSGQVGVSQCAGKVCSAPAGPGPHIRSRYGFGPYHFVAEWAEPICGPHRAEVASAADRLGMTVRESDHDRATDEVRRSNVLNVPALAIEDTPESLVVGAFGADQLVERLRRFVGDRPAP